MCGIWALIDCKKCLTDDQIRLSVDQIRHRGPDFSTVNQESGSVWFGFHRLSIIDNRPESNQPLRLGNKSLICNGEIYNYRQLGEKFNMTTGSDCEVINHLYQQNPRVEEWIQQLDAEFAFVLYDKSDNRIVIGRDRFGVRPLFIGLGEEGQIMFCSEMKGLVKTDLSVKIKPFPPGYWMSINLDQVINQDWLPTFHKYHYLPVLNRFNPIDQTVYQKTRELLTLAVQKRLMSDRPLGCLLSGGLDSSLVVSLVYNLIPKARETIHCFTIGLKGSVDILAAKKVAEWIGIKNHHVVEFTVKEGFDVLPEVIEQLETYDVTTIRASIPQYLLAKYIRTNTNVKVLLSGEGADELFAGYQYFKKTSFGQELNLESHRLLTDLYMFDNLRTDRTTAKWGLEVRVPFLDMHLVDYILSLDPSARLCHDRMEKMLLRDSFNCDNLFINGVDVRMSLGYLPNEILYRGKEAFSDAVSSKEESWYQGLSKLIHDANLQNKLAYNFNPPQTPEAAHYRECFEKFYPNRAEVIKYYWMPKWVKLDNWDPSATALDCHVGDL